MGTTTLIPRTDTVPADALDEAVRWLRLAATVPYDAREPAAWLQEFQACIGAARRELAGRSVTMRDERGVLPRLLPLAERAAGEHEGVTRLADDLFTDAYLATEPDLLEMVELAEAAKALEQAINGLRERRSDLLFESTHRDLGGGG